MKILWLGNAPYVGSGYGVQAGMFAPRIAALGHDLAFAANWGAQGACLDWNGHRIYPADGEWGNRTMPSCAAHHADGIENCQVIALCDPWVLNPETWPDELRLALWAPVDKQPLPGVSRKVLARHQVTPLAMSRFGERMMQDAGLDPFYVPHGVETDVFRPMGPDVRAAVRREMGISEDAFVVGIVAANAGVVTVSRKAFPQMFQAFARFRETHRDAVMYAHTHEFSYLGSGINLRPLATACGLPRNAVRFTEAFDHELGWPRWELANCYQAFDVLLNTSMGEGFGVPIVEAQACGVPVVVTDHTSMTELCGAGWLVEGDLWYDAPHEAFSKVPFIDSIVGALEQAYEAREDRELRARAREFALGYDADRVTAEYWAPVLDRLGQPREVGPLMAAVA